MGKTKRHPVNDKKKLEKAEAAIKKGGSKKYGY